MLIRLNSAELAAVLAGLRAWQAVDGGLTISPPRRAAIRDIINGSGTLRPLTPDEIDALIERINVLREEGQSSGDGSELDAYFNHKNCSICHECITCNLRPCRDGGPHKSDDEEETPEEVKESDGDYRP